MTTSGTRETRETELCRHMAPGPQMHDPHENNGPPEAGSNNTEQNDSIDINEEDIVEVIDLEDEPDEDLVGEMEDMDLQDGEQDTEGAEGMEVTDDAKLVFSKHTGSVYCVQSDPSCSLAVTGGGDDTAYVWHITDGQVLFQCTGHKDSVTCASFSHDGKYVATADMGGIIQVWQVSKKEVIWSFEIGDLEWLEWHPGAPVLLAGSLYGNIWMWKIPSGDTKTFPYHGCGCDIAKVLPSGKEACAGYSDGVVKVWDLKGGNAVHTVSGHTAHTASISSIDTHKTEPVVLTGSMDLTAKLINTTNGKVVTTFNCSPSQYEYDSVEAVGFATGLPLVATGTLSGTLTLWDIPTQVARQKCQHEDGIVRLKWNDNTPVVYTCTLRGTVHVWDGRSGQQVRQFTGHTAEILDFHLARNNEYILTGSGDNTARIFHLNT